ncbi:helix-turn-helix domain-containing protein [Anaerotignum sp.]
MAYTNKFDEEKYNNPFSTRLRELMDKEGDKTSQAELARLMRERGVTITSQAIGAYYRGETMPKLEHAQTIADCFNVSLDYLSGRSDIPSRNEIVQNINAETGLSQDAIIELMGRKAANRKEKAHFISHLIEDVELSSLITAIRCKNNFKETHETVLIEAGEYSNFVDLESVYKTEAETIFWKIVSTYKPNKEG